jgi:tetratricopeptide (TPR) repeat protein
MVSALSTSTENSFANNIDKQQRKSIRAPQLIAQISAEERLKERANQEVAETTKQIKTCQTNWKLYYSRASALSTLVRYEEALEDSAKAIKLDPKQIEPLLLHARLSENTLDDEAAAKDYTAAINLGTPISSSVMLLRSHCYESMMKPKLALADALGYLDGHPERYDTNLARIVGTLYLKLGKGKEAAEHFTYCLKIKPKMSKVREMRGDAYMLLKDYNAAAADYTLEIERIPNIVAKLYAKRANAYRKAGQLKKAEQDEIKIKSVSHEVFDIAPFRN